MLYENGLSLKEKIETIAKEIYGAATVSYAPAAEKALKKITEMGFGDVPVCMAKNQYSLSDDPTLLGRPENFNVNIREVYVSAGAGFVRCHHRCNYDNAWSSEETGCGRY